MTTRVDTDTREALLDAAETLFATEGVDRVSLATITRLAGQRNGGAIHYYFGGRDGLLAAILDRHEAILDEIRMDALIELRRSGTPTAGALLRVVVESLAGRLDSDSGRSFLAIQRNRLVANNGSWTFRSASVRLIAAETDMFLEVAGFDEDQRVERTRLVTQLVIHRLADRSREETLGTPTSRTLVIETLITSATAILSIDGETES